MNWVTVAEPGELGWIKCLDGIWWHQAPAPPRSHECSPQTRGWLERYYERCACGAVRSACAPPAYDKPWKDRNSR